MKHTLISAALFAGLASAGAQAQTIERVKMTDNDLSCQQIYGEINQMDFVIARGSAPAAVQVAQADPNAVAGAQMANAVAQTAVAAALVKNAGSFGGFGNLGNLGNLGGAAGGLGGMFGGLAQLAQGATAQQAANSGAAVQQMTAQQVAGNSGQTVQAQARKEHLTGMFLSKPCKMSEIQK